MYRSIRRLLLGVVATAALLLSVPALTTVANAETFVPIRLTAVDIEDAWPDNSDEISLRYLGNDWKASMKPGVSGYPPAANFSGSVTVDLWELDSGNWLNPHDFLGTHTISANEKDWGERTYYFSTWSATYKLVYDIQ